MICIETMILANSVRRLIALTLTYAIIEVA
jgi:hypothetical protein